MFPHIIKEFKVNHPGVRVQMTDYTTTAMERKIVNGDVDSGVGEEPGSRADEIEFSPISEDPFVLVCRKDHPLADRRTDQAARRRPLTCARNASTPWW